MNLSKQSIDTLIDLVEIKLSCFEVWDRDDRREMKALETCRRELLAARGGTGAERKSGELVAFDRRPETRRAAAG